MSHPTDLQKEFFDKIIDAPQVATGKVLDVEKHVGEGDIPVPIPNESTVLVLKHPCGLAVNIRGPFKLSKYEFTRDDGKAKSETVVDAKWAGGQESDAHLHLNWELVRYAKLEETNNEIKLNIKHHWKLSFLNVAKEPLFWFYLENDNHRAFVAYVSKYDRDPRKKDPTPNTLVDLVSGLPQ